MYVIDKIILFFLLVVVLMAGVKAEEVVYVSPVYRAAWDRVYSHNIYEEADGATPQEACEGVLAQNPIGLEDYVYSHYMDDWVGKRCALESISNPGSYTRIWIGYPVYRCPMKSSYSTLLMGCVCNNGFFVEGQACTPPIISIDGASSTQALPSVIGPIRLKISITHNGHGKKSMQFMLRIQEEGSINSNTISGVVDENGAFEFIYVPPYFKNAVVKLTASCSTCINVAAKSVEVVGVSSDFGLCRR